MPANRSAYKSGVNTAIFTNTYKFIKGNTVRDKLNLLADSVLFYADDANIPGGYMAIDTNGRVDISFINAASPASHFLQDDGTWGTPAGLPSNLQDVLATGNVSGVNDILMSVGQGMDSETFGDTLNIGATNSAVINYGNSTTTHNFLGTAIYELQVNSYVTDKLMTLNYGGAVSSGVGVGFEIQENNAITGYFKTNAARNAFSFRAPAIGFSADLSLAAITANRIYTLPDIAGVIALINGGQTFSSGTWQGTAIAGAYLDNTGVIAKVLTAYAAAPGTITNTDSILQAIQKLDGNNQAQDDAFDMATQMTHLYYTNR